jgi:hypothetical protein
MRRRCSARTSARRHQRTASERNRTARAVQFSAQSLSSSSVARRAAALSRAERVRRAAAWRSTFAGGRGLFQRVRCKRRTHRRGAPAVAASAPSRAATPRKLRLRRPSAAEAWLAREACSARTGRASAHGKTTGAHPRVATLNEKPYAVRRTHAARAPRPVATGSPGRRARSCSDHRSGILPKTGTCAAQPQAWRQRDPYQGSRPGGLAGPLAAALLAPAVAASVRGGACTARARLVHNTVFALSCVPRNTMTKPPGPRLC